MACLVLSPNARKTGSGGDGGRIAQPDGCPSSRWLWDQSTDAPSQSEEAGIIGGGETCASRKMSKTFYIIDGHSEIYRCYYAPFDDLNAPSGEPTKATYLFTKMLLKLCREKQPDYLAMATDGKRELLRRRARYDKYKAQRPPPPDALILQVKRIKQIVRLLGIPVLQSPEHEADDVVATLVECVKDRDIDVVIISKDKDLMQLLGPKVRMYQPSTETYTTAAQAEAKWGVKCHELQDLFTLMGDTSDNIPGVPGVGQVTAVKLMMQFRTVHNMLVNFSAGEYGVAGKAMIKKITDAADSGLIKLSRDLVRLQKDVPLDFEGRSLRFRGADIDATREIFNELGFKRWATTL